MKEKIKLWFRYVTVHCYLDDYYFFRINICGVDMSQILLNWKLISQLGTDPLSELEICSIF